MSQQHSGGGDISRSLALMWGYDDKSGGRGPKPRLTLGAIVEQAVAVADAEGLSTPCRCAEWPPTSACAWGRCRSTATSPARRSCST